VTQTSGRSRSRTPSRTQSQKRRVPVLAIALVAIGLVAIIGIAISVGGEAERQDDAPAFGPVVVEGQSLAPLPDSGTDPAVGSAAPIAGGIDPDEVPTTIGEPGEPTIVAFLAHWCPHCNAELPILVDLQEDGTFDGVRTVAVLTGTNEAAPNYPPVSWLEDSGWSGDILLDDEAFTAAAAYGLSSYPFLVALDADGNVVARTSGERSAEEVAAMADAARGGS
jgi:cytochrome c biogenesis protein CcmG, thiol:disulfide interchange protein DsbE